MAQTSTDQRLSEILHKTQPPAVAKTALPSQTSPAFTRRLSPQFAQKSWYPLAPSRSLGYLPDSPEPRPQLGAFGSHWVDRGPYYGYIFRIATGQLQRIGVFRFRDFPKLGVQFWGGFPIVRTSRIYYLVVSTMGVLAPSTPEGLEPLSNMQVFGQDLGFGMPARRMPHLQSILGWILELMV